MDISKILTKSNFTNSVIQELYVKSLEITNDTTKQFIEYVIERLCDEVERLTNLDLEHDTTKIEKLEDEVSDLEDTIEDFEDEKGSLESDIEELQSRVKDLEFDLSCAEDTISDLERELNSEKEENENLRIRLNE